jgi:DNA polymerase-3 subunit beta
MAIIKELPETEVRMETDEKGHLILKCEKSHFRLFTMPPEEFPSEPGITEDKLVSIDANFFDSLGKVKYASSREESRYHINGVYLDKDAVATDGHRMAVVRRKLGFDNIIIPLDFVNIILKARNRKDGCAFQAGCSNNIFFLKTRDLILFGRLIDGEFPDYSQVIPNDSLRYASVDKSKLSQAIKRIMLMSGKNYQMKFEFWQSSLVLSSCTPDLGDATEEMEIEFRSDRDENKPFAIGLNGRYLLDMLEVLEGERVNIGMYNELAPIKVEENNSVHILMPLRLVESEPKTESETEIEHDIEPESHFVEEVEVE